MLEFTAPDGSTVRIDPAHVVRARRTLSIEGDRSGSRIDWVTMQLVSEPINNVAPAIRAQLESFTHLTARDGSSIWFDAKKVKGPVALTPRQLDGAVQSAIILMRYRQYVTESPAEVRRVITKAGGKPLP